MKWSEYVEANTKAKDIFLSTPIEAVLELVSIRHSRPEPEPVLAILYHANCCDGAMAAALCERYRKNIYDNKWLPKGMPQNAYMNILACDEALYIPVQYNNPPPVLPDCVSTIVVVDFSFSTEELEKAYSSNITIVQYDHHRSAIERYEAKAIENKDFDFNLVNTDPKYKHFSKTCKCAKEGSISTILCESMSGAGLVFTSLLNIDVPAYEEKEKTQYALHQAELTCCSRNNFVSLYDTWYTMNLASSLVQDRDLWRFAYTQTKPFHLFVRQKMDTGGFPAVVDILSKTWSYIENEILPKYEAILEYEYDRQKNIAAKASKFIDDKGRVGYIVACPSFDASNIGSMLTEDSPEVDYALMYVTTKNKIIFSVRSKNGKALEVAKEFGGGGHPNAAGFNTTYDTLTTFYNYIK